MSHGSSSRLREWRAPAAAGSFRPGLLGESNRRIDDDQVCEADTQPDHPAAILALNHRAVGARPGSTLRGEHRLEDRRSRVS
jgi:hypothetical protein